MFERRADEAIQQTGNGMRRRGILAAAGAVVAGIVAKQASEPVAAGVDGDVVLGSVGNVAATETGVLNNGPASPGGPAIHGFRSPGAVAVVATTLNAGVVGQTFVADGPGVYGSSPNGSQAKGVHGISGAGYGVFGDGATGVHGESTSSTGVQGLIPNTTGAASTIAVFGSNQSTGTGGVGVRGDCGPGIGVLGQSTTSTGVYGSTVSGLYGIVGASGSAVGSAGLLGVANGPNAVGFGTIAQGGATFAGYFNGTTVVNGTFAVTGGKAAAVQDATGDYQLMYCVEAPEAWFEDFGKGKLAGGKAAVQLDPAFARHIDTDDYHVFLTPYDAACKGLAVTSVRADGFVVGELNGGGSSGAFSWRVVGRRADLVGERLGKFRMPPGLKLPEGTPPVTNGPQPAPPPRPSPPAASSPGSGTTPSDTSSPPVQPAPPPRP